MGRLTRQLDFLTDASVGYDRAVTLNAKAIAVTQLRCAIAVTVHFYPSSCAPSGRA